MRQSPQSLSKPPPSTIHNRRHKAPHQQIPSITLNQQSDPARKQSTKTQRQSKRQRTSIIAPNKDYGEPNQSSNRQPTRHDTDYKQPTHQQSKEESITDGTNKPEHIQKDLTTTSCHSKASAITPMQTPMSKVPKIMAVRAIHEIASYPNRVTILQKGGGQTRKELRSHALIPVKGHPIFGRSEASMEESPGSKRRERQSAPPSGANVGADPEPHTKKKK